VDNNITTLVSSLKKELIKSLGILKRGKGFLWDSPLYLFGPKGKKENAPIVNAQEKKNILNKKKKTSNKLMLKVS
jgi:hypothetical protein